MLVIAALTSREKLLHDGAHMELLRDQVETFAQELDESKTGLLDDYPGECYPGDVMAALMCIKRADAVLGTDHSRVINRALRAFIGPGSPGTSCRHTWRAPQRASLLGSARMRQLLHVPDRARTLAVAGQAVVRALRPILLAGAHNGCGLPGVPKDVPHAEWTMDVDAGPVIAGHGVAASAFGVGAARKNGRFDRAYPLSAEMLATVGELPNGVLAMPRSFPT